MKSIGNWFNSEVGAWRSGAATLWVGLVLTPLMFVFITLARVEIFHPLQWLAECSLMIISIRVWAYIFICSFAFVIVSAWNTKFYSVRPTVILTRLSYIRNILNPQRLFHAGAYTFIGCLTAWCYTYCIESGYQGISKQCQENESYHCVNELHVFLILHGAFVGLLNSILFFVTPLNHVTFPIIQQSKFFQVKSSFSALLVSSVKSVLWQLRIYYPLFYLLLGPAFIRTISQHLTLNRSESASLLSLAGLLNLGLLWQVLVVGTLIHFTFSFARLIHCVYQTQPYEFPVETCFTESDNHCLQQALSCENHPTVQYLGYLDLYLLSRNNTHRRQEIFSLSQPGGHPHNWTSISTQCLSLLCTLTESLTLHNNKVISSGSIRQLSGDKATSQSSKSELELNAANDLTQRSVLNISALSSPAPSHSVLSQASTPGTKFKSHFAKTQSVQQLGPLKPDQPPVHQTFWNKVWDQLKKRRAVAFFVAELPDAAGRDVFRDCQLAIWSAQALSNLCAASFTEDKYGVVQKSLPEIITVLLSLQEAVEKHFKLGAAVNRKPTKGTSLTPDGILKSALKTSLKTALYRIVTTFDKHLGSYVLSSEHSRRLRLFMEYKE